MATLGAYSKKHKVAIIGSGNWGSTIAKVIAENTKANPALFEEQITMWVHEEQVSIPKESKHYSPDQPDKQNLSEVINRLHENVKYLPGITLPSNVVAVPNIVEAAKDATILIFNLPHQFVRKVCDQLKGNILPYARGISCIKGIEVSEKGVSLISDVIGQRLNIYCGALSGANIASEIALGKWCETTVAYDPPSQDSRHPSPSHSPSASQVNLPQINTPDDKPKSSSGSEKLSPLPSEFPPLSHENIKKLIHRPYFHVTLTTDVVGVSLGGALKNIVALAAGFVDGLGWGDNAKAAVMRVGILEEVKFGQLFFKGRTETSTFTEQSCGVADVITSCMGGRNFRCAKKAVEKGVSVQEVEKTDLNGQVLQGTSTAEEVNRFLKSRGQEKEFPLFTVVWEILEGKAKPEDIPDRVES